MSSNICILTSCIFPNTFAGNISNFSFSERLSRFSINFEHIRQLNCFDFVYVIDSSPDSFFTTDSLYQLFCKATQGSLHRNHFIHFKPSASQLLQIQIKGKGLSETLMVEHATRHMAQVIPYDKYLLFKISARYKIVNLSSIVNEVIKTNDFSKRSLWISYSQCFSKCSTVLYAFNSTFNFSNVPLWIADIADERGIYLEHLFFTSLVLHSFHGVKRLKRVPYFSRDTLSGSLQGRYNFTKQLLSKLMLKFF